MGDLPLRHGADALSKVFRLLKSGLLCCLALDGDANRPRQISPERLANGVDGEGRGARDFSSKRTGLFTERGLRSEPIAETQLQRLLTGNATPCVEHFLGGLGPHELWKGDR